MEKYVINIKEEMKYQMAVFESFKIMGVVHHFATLPTDGNKKYRGQSLCFLFPKMARRTSVAVVSERNSDACTRRTACSKSCHGRFYAVL